MRSLVCSLLVLGFSAVMACDGGSDKNTGDVADASSDVVADAVGDAGPDAGPDAVADAVGDADVAADADAAGDADADAVVDVCSGVTCSGAGACVAVAGAASCDCDADYAAVELTCINAKMVPCLDDAPAHATSAAAVDVEVTYTDAAGWSSAASCGWTCDAEWTQVGERCLGADFIDAQCRAACLEWESCGTLADQSVDACVTSCVEGAGDGDALAKAACVGLSYHHDALWCGVVDSCETLSTGDACAARCAAEDACGFLAAPGLTSGTSVDECEVLCRAYETIYGFLETDVVYESCLTEATSTCDRYQMGLCESYNGATLCGNVCGWLGTADFCGYIPGRWDDDTACELECETWSAEQAHAVFGCYNKLSFSGCDTDRAVACFSPPSEVPAGFKDFAKALAQVCPYATASADDDVNTWHLLGRAQLWPAWMSDYAGATECVKAHTSCPSYWNFDWLAPCFLAIDADVASACNAAQTCLANDGTMVPYLTIDGTTTKDSYGCQVAWQEWKSADAEAFGGTATCLKAVDASNCTAVAKCIEVGDPVVAACDQLTTCWDEAGTSPYGLTDVDGELCAGLLAFGQNPTTKDCVLAASDCAGRNACLPISAPANNAESACTDLVPCWEGVSVNPFPALGTLSVGSCVAAVSIFNALQPGAVDLVYNCLQTATDCGGRLACLPAP
jgi:hypothetical protein